MILVKLGDTAHPFDVLMVSSSDHVSPLTGATLTVARSKNGAAFAAWAGSVAEIGSGVYKLTPAAGDVDTVGELAIHVTATSADPADLLRQVISFDPYDATRLGVTALPNANAGANGGLPTGNASGQVTVASIVANAVDATALATSAVNEIADGVWDEAIAGHVSSGSTGAKLNALSSGGSGGPVGSGSTAYPVTVTRPDGVTPIEGVAVWVSTDAAGTNVVAGTLYTDTLGRINGTVGFMLDPGTYELWRQHGSWTFTNPTAFTVT